MRNLFLVLLLVVGCMHDHQTTPHEACHAVGVAIDDACPVNGASWLSTYAGRTHGTCNSAIAFDEAALDACLLELDGAACDDDDDVPAVCAAVVTEWAP